jgi:hypothetical protein
VHEAELAGVGLDQPGDEEVVALGVEDVAVEDRASVLPVERLVVEEREADPVAGREHHQVGLDPGAVGEDDLPTLEAVDVGLRGDRAVADVVQQLLVDDRVGLEEPVVRGRQTEPLVAADDELGGQSRTAPGSAGWAASTRRPGR